jgi:UDP-N-acetylmuramoyl-L-alanyl-D-glutamate--2,6-diaminopimelate ligase
MNLREVIGEGAPDVEVTSLAYDSRSAGPGALFFCVPGFRHDGHDFAADAVARGAAALVVERPLELDVPQVEVESTRAAMAPAAARFFGHPSHRLDVVGITGTNGKTTTAFLVRALLQAGGRACGLLGTVTSVIGGQAREVVRTTPEAVDLQRDFAAMVAAGDSACVLEVSSHALELDRAAGVRWAAAVFTNLSRDHLDFHPTMEDYFTAKRRLFEAGPRVAAANVDDAYGRRLADELPGVTTFAIDADADYAAYDVRSSLDGSSFSLRTPDGELQLRSALPGRFNVSNLLGAVVVARELGVPDEVVVRAAARAGRVPGRLERVDEGQDFAVLVDYAHTPDSLANVLQAARELTAHRLLCVFGCGGDRDRGKRPLMGAVAADLADVVIVTSDNPRSEDPEAIIAEILAGAGAGVEAIPDRRAAIERAVERARPGDVVVIAGKGHEKGQELAGGRRVPFDDVMVAREALHSTAVRS